MSAEAWSQLVATNAADVPLTFVDVETTGLSASGGDRICEVAVVHCRGWREVERFVSLVNPGRGISPGAAAVNGITAAMVRKAPRFASVAADVARLLEAGVTVAHNSPFDLSFLRQEISRAGVPLPAVPVLDTLAIARRCFSFPSNSLGQLTARLGVTPGGHRALSDALATRGVLEQFVQRLEPKDRGLTLGDLLALQGRVAVWMPPDKASGIWLSPDTPPAIPLPDNAPPTTSLSPELSELVRTRSRVRLRYQSAGGDVTERLVQLLGVRIGDGTAHLVGYCQLRQEQRSFRVDRILDWERGE